MNVILASASPRRKELIARISGLHAQTHAAQSEENAPFINPGWYACALARHKAEEVAARLDTDEAFRREFGCSPSQWRHSQSAR